MNTSRCRGVKYIVYNNKQQRDDLNLNVIQKDQAREFPTKLYSGQPFGVSDYICDDGPRDVDTNYIYNVERLEHPDYFSRFSYGTSDNGYGVGHWPGKYNTPAICQPFTSQDPAFMAPSRFYDEPVDCSSNINRDCNPCGSAMLSTTNGFLGALSPAYLNSKNYNGLSNKSVGGCCMPLQR